MEYQTCLHHEEKTLEIMKTLITTLSLLMAAILLQSNASVITISGIVLDESKAPMPGVSVLIQGSNNGTITDINGKYSIQAHSNDILEFSFIGFKTKTEEVKGRSTIDVTLRVDVSTLDEVVKVGYGNKTKKEDVAAEYELAEDMAISTGAVMRSRPAGGIQVRGYSNHIYAPEAQDFNTEEYDVISENGFKQPKDAPLSTFSIDVDAASYANVRRMIQNGQKPNKDAVRIEEMINYFHYDYENPTGQHPFNIQTEVSTAPWNPKHKLVHIGVQGKKLTTDQRVSSNLVFLIDVSGSMSDHNKLPLLKSSMKLLVNNLSDHDRVAIVVYAGAAGLVLPSTPASERRVIFEALDRLSAGGSTAGGAGIELAYKVAVDNLIEGGNNRVILATDGDFNMGSSSNSEMVELIKDKRKSGVYLTITGFGMGNYKDSKMEQISNAGNGNYFYIDSYREATKVFGAEMQATLFTIAKDVKIQVEFNPAVVQSYRLIGYENRKLRDEDFNNDKIDAGELGAGHSVTALYEIVPAGVVSEYSNSIDPLKYQTTPNTQQSLSNEMMTIKMRYKPIGKEQSKLITAVIDNETTPLAKTSDNFRFSASVASFGMIMRDSEFKQESSLTQVMELARQSVGTDEMGYRQEFIGLVSSYASITGNGLTKR